MKKKIIYILFIAMLIIIGIIILKINYSNNFDKNKNDNQFANTSWIKSRSEYYRDVSVKYKDELIKNTYIDFKETTMKFCNYNEKNEPECDEYNYLIKDNLLIVYDSNNNEITYTYEVINNNQLILINDNEGSVWTNYYNISLG